jgi:hypothetical protein
MPVSVLFLVGANLLPLAGVVLWGWDTFVILILYWLETAVIAFWTIVRGLFSTDAERNRFNVTAGGDAARPFGRVGLALFFTVHAGIFMSVHFLFLWSLFAGDWPSRVHGPVDFVREVILDTGLWLPLLILFVVRGWLVLGPAIVPRVRLLRLLPAPSPIDGQEAIIGLYVRVFVMQVAIIFGGWLATLLGAPEGALILLIVAKTLTELYFGPLVHQVETSAAKAAAERDGRG